MFTTVINNIRFMYSIEKKRNIDESLFDVYRNASRREIIRNKMPLKLASVIFFFSSMHREINHLCTIYVFIRPMKNEY